MKIAQIQMHVSGDKTADLRHAAELIRGAGEIDLAVLPEMFCCPYDNSCFHRYGEEAGGEAQQALSALARERGIWLIGGSIPELEGGNVYNTSFVYAPDGSCAARGEGAVRARGLQHDDRASALGTAVPPARRRQPGFYRRHLARARRERVLPRMGPLHRL